MIIFYETRTKISNNNGSIEAYIVQHFPTPKRFLASKNTSYSDFMRNSDSVIPVTFNLVLANKTLSRITMSVNLTSLSIISNKTKIDD